MFLSRRTEEGIHSRTIYDPEPTRPSPIEDLHPSQETVVSHRKWTWAYFTESRGLGNSLNKPRSRRVSAVVSHPLTFIISSFSGAFYFS